MMQAAQRGGTGPNAEPAGSGVRCWDMGNGIGPRLYCAWTILAVGGSIALAGLAAESVTRLLVLGFLGVQLAFREHLVAALPRSFRREPGSSRWARSSPPSSRAST